jgi:hypothetical protein
MGVNADVQVQAPGAPSWFPEAAFSSSSWRSISLQPGGRILLTYFAKISYKSILQDHFTKILYKNILQKHFTKIFTNNSTCVALPLGMPKANERAAVVHPSGR